MNNETPPPQPPPLPFGDPTNIQRENAAAVRKGVAFGCGGCAAVVAFVLACIVAFCFVVLMFMRSSEPSQMTFKMAQQSAVLKREIGEPMSLDWLVFGSVNTENGAGHANLSIPISGPRGSVRIQTVGSKSNDVWTLSEMSTTLPSGEVMDLISSPAEPNP